MGRFNKPIRPIFDIMTKGIKGARSLMEEGEAFSKRTERVPVKEELPPDKLPPLNEGKKVVADGEPPVKGEKPIEGEVLPPAPEKTDVLDVGAQLTPEEQQAMIKARGKTEPLDEQGKYIVGDNKYTNMNFSRINNEEDLTGFMNEAMKVQEQRGVGLPKKQVLKKTEEAAKSVPWEQIMKSAKEGRRLNDKELTRARQVEGQLFEQFGAMTDDMIDKIEKGIVTEVDELEHAKFGSIVTAVHRFVGAEKTKASQALNSLRIDIDNQFLSNLQRKQLIDQMAATGGSFKNRVMAIKNATSIGDVAKVVENDKLFSRLGRVGANHWFNNLLAMFAPMKAAIGGTITTTVFPTESLITAALGGLRKSMGKVTGTGKLAQDVLNDRARFGEAMIEYTGNFSGFREAVTPIIRHLKDPTYNLGESRYMRYMRPEDKLHGQLAARRPEGKLGPGGVALDVTSQVVDGLLQDFSSRGLLMTDMVVKSVAFRKTVDKLAYRIAANEGLEGKELIKRVEQVVTDMPNDVFEEAILTGKRATLTNELEILWFENTRKFIQNTRGLKFFAPFTKTMFAGSELAIERIPGIGMVSPRIRDMWKAGGEQRDRVVAQWTFGMTAIGMGANDAMDGRATSGAGYSKKEKSARFKANWRPGLVGKDGSYYNFNFYSPMSELYMLGVASYEMFDRQNHNLTPDDPRFKSRTQVFMEMLPQAAWAFVEMNLGKSVGTGFREMIQAIDEPARYGNRKVISVVEPMFQVWGSKLTRRQADPVRRRVPSSEFVTELWDSIKNSTPGLSDDLPPQIGYFGEQRPEYGMSDLFGYIPGTKYYKEFQELFANGRNVSLPSQSITVGTRGSATTINLDKDILPDQYKDSYIKKNPLAGQRGYAYYRFSIIRGEQNREVLKTLFSRSSDYWSEDLPYGKANNQDSVLTKGDVIDKALRVANRMAVGIYSNELQSSLKDIDRTLRDVRGRIKTKVGAMDVPEGLVVQGSEAEKVRQATIAREKKQRAGVNF